MCCKDNKRSYRDFNYYLKDVRCVAIKEEDADIYTDILNDQLQYLEDEGNTVVAMSSIINDYGFNTIIDFVPNDKIYWKGGDESGRGEQVSEQNEDT